MPRGQGFYSKIRDIITAGKKRAEIAELYREINKGVREVNR